jgi:high-affinity iron transporter
LSQDGILGQFLHIVVGYVAQPQGIQVVFYVLTLLLIIAASMAARRSADARQSAGGAA